MVTVATGRRFVVALFVLSLAAMASAQESRSAVLAKQLAAALDAAKLDSVAARDPENPGVFIAALYFPGQLLVASAQYSAPSLLSEKVGKKEYRDVYIDLNSASMPATKVFIEDGGADGLKLKKSNGQADTYESGGKRIAFDNDWKKQNLSEDDYNKGFASADERYAQLLTALLNEVKKPS
jgi:hypothetical protein